MCETGTAAPNASLYEEEHLAKTYIVEDSQTHDNLAYFSLLFDKIERSIADPAIWNKLSRKIPNAKRRSSYPALKIGRLDAMSSAGIPTEFHSYQGLPHGFGLGTGTVAEGWIDDAIAFWGKNME